MTTRLNLVHGLSLFLFVFLLLSTPLQSQEMTGEKGLLSKVPVDAMAFCHVKASELWKSDMLGGARELLQKVGAPALQAFNKRFAPGAANIDSICAFVLPPEEDHPPIGAVLVSFSEAFDSTKVLKSLLPNGTVMNHFGQKYTADAKLDIAIKAVDTRTLMACQVANMPVIISREVATDGPMKKHFLTANGKAIYLMLNMQAMPQDWKDMIPEPYEKVSSAQELVITGQLAKELALTATLQYGDEATAKEAESAVRTGLQAARDHVANMTKDVEKKVLALPEGKNPGISELPDALGSIVNLAMLKALDETLQGAPIKLSGTTLSAEYSFDANNPKLVVYSGGMLAGLLMPAMQKTRDVAARAKGQSNLKQLALAMHNYESAEEHLPVAIFAKGGKKQPLLSWRVALLPYLGQKELYKQFKTDEPWDSEHNKKLIEKIPAVFMDADAPPAKELGMTHYQVIINGGFILKKDENHLRDVIDGTSNTIMIATATEPVIWTKPQDVQYDPLKPVPKLGFGGKPANVAMFDGSVRTLKDKIPEKVLRAIITRASGELISEDF